VSFLPRTRGGALWRFVLAALVVVGFTAATTSVAALLQVKQIVKYLDQTAPLKHADVTLPAPGAPETLLLIGSDHRAGTSYTSANTDTMMLVRIDDNSSTINMLSIPRDLQVEGPNGAAVKLNAIYSEEGGPGALVQVLKQQVFPGLQVNHVLDLNFAGFSDLIDAIGCVYADVDHRYYNNTELTDYSSIDIQPGYQKLCGDDQSISGALAFVRFRHTDSDEVRNARQQDFIRWAKDGYSVDQLIANKDKLLQIFGAHVQTDRFLHSTDGLLDLFDLIVNADKFTLKTIQFPEYFGPCGGNAQTPCYVFPTSAAAEEQAYQKFITPTPITPTSTTTATTPATATTGVAHRAAPPAIPLGGLIADPGDGKSQSAQLGHVALPVYYPKYIVGGSEYCFSITANCDDGQEPEADYTASYPRKYMIHGYGNTPYSAYVMTIVINSALGEYYTVQGTTWQHPPILKSPSKVTVVGGKKLFEYTDGGKIALVAYHTPQAVYWISNTLANQIPNSQMVGMAATLTPAG
jgi:polyisoprenyl-teichoic acid--peptidoglycan teichoic acid transferase